MMQFYIERRSTIVTTNYKWLTSNRMCITYRNTFEERRNKHGFQFIEKKEQI